MKNPIDFVKNFGWDEAKRIVNSKAVKLGLAREIVGWKNIDFDELKRLVEAHELVELYGGLESAKQCLLLAPYATDLDGSVDALNQAIILVESCKNISPISGHEIKHREAKKLSKDIEKFLKGRKVKVIESTFKPKKPREECKPFRPETNWKYKPSNRKNSNERIVEQSDLLSKYVSLAPKHCKWVKLMEKISHVTTQKSLVNVYNAQYSFANDETWAVIKNAVEELIIELSDKNEKI